MNNLKTESLSEKVSGTLHPGEQTLLDVLAPRFQTPFQTERMPICKLADLTRLEQAQAFCQARGRSDRLYRFMILINMSAKCVGTLIKIR